ncbi:MAG: isochorismatase family protein [Alicyclobacillaceae bacterium]|nr:isochorismatase family protein [Alicyclobacillaceae bacterium]
MRLKKALIITDVQEDFLGNTLDYIETLCQKYLDEHGNDYDLIILTRWVHEDNRDENTLRLHHDKAVVVEKNTYSAYNDRVREELEKAGIEEVHLAGVDTETTVLATMFALVDAGYKVKILQRLCGSYFTHGANTMALKVAGQVLGQENLLYVGGDRVWL